MSGDDKVGWGAVDPGFLAEVERKRHRAISLLQRLKESKGSVNSARRVRIWQDLRELDILPEDHIFYMIAWELGFIASERHQRLYAETYEPKFRAIYEAYGVDYDDLEAGWQDPPDELVQLNEALGQDEDRLREEVYREFGEDEMADQWRDDRDAFDGRVRRGQDMAHPGLRDRLDQMIRGEIEPHEVFKAEK